jgi:hypothetical protein
LSSKDLIIKIALKRERKINSVSGLSIRGSTRYFYPPKIGLSVPPDFK